MSEPLMSLEARVSALEAALTASEQWNVCVCGHHGSAHDMRNKCMVCKCRHFGTRRPANTPIHSAELIDAVKALRAIATAVLSGDEPEAWTKAVNARDDNDLARIDAWLAQEGRDGNG